MGRLLLTSSQVGLVLSGVIILLFTTALFFAGYVLQQNTVIHLREAIRPKGLPIHTDLYTPQTHQLSIPGASPSAKEGGAFPDYQDVEIKHSLEAGVLEPYSKGYPVAKEEALSANVVVTWDTTRLATSDDQASFSERRKADKMAADRAAKAIKVTENSIQPQAEVLHSKSKVSGAGPYLGSIYEEAKRRLRMMGKSDSIENAENLLTTNLQEMTTAQRRKVFLEQLAKGQSPDVQKNPWAYRRRTWLEG